MPIPRSVALASALLLASSGLAAAGADSAPRAPVGTDLDRRGGTLSDKLGDTGGVIRPSGDVDPAIRRPAPAAGSMPVIKPGEVAPGTAK